MAKKPKRPKGTPTPNKASEAKIAQRVEVILQLKLDGAEPWNIMQYCSEKQALGEEPWVRGPGQKPLCERQLRTYMARADAMLSEVCLQHAQNALHTHLAQRRGLYARAVSDGDYRTALAILQDLAQLADLYPAPKRQSVELSGGVRLELVEEIIDPHGDDPQIDPPAPGPG